MKVKEFITIYSESRESLLESLQFAINADEKIIHENFDSFEGAYNVAIQKGITIKYCPNTLKLYEGFLVFEQREAIPPFVKITWHLVVPLFRRKNVNYKKRSRAEV